MGDIYTATLAAHDWSMYDITGHHEAVGGPHWGLLAAQGPADQALDGGTYILAPNPAEGETLREAVKRQGGIGAHLRIANFDSSEYAGIQLTCSPRFAFFTRLTMHAAGVELHSYTPPNVSATDRVQMRHDVGPAVFARDFGVMTAEEFRTEYARWH